MQWSGRACSLNCCFFKSQRDVFISSRHSPLQSSPCWLVVLNTSSCLENQPQHYGWMGTLAKAHKEAVGGECHSVVAWMGGRVAVPSSLREGGFSSHWISRGAEILAWHVLEFLSCRASFQVLWEQLWWQWGQIGTDLHARLVSSSDCCSAWASFI